VLTFILAKKMKIPKFVGEVTTEVNSRVGDVLSQKGFPYPYYKMLKYSMKSFKRRWDAALLICLLGALDYDQKRAYQIATATSLLVPALFVVDDLIDESRKREDRTTLWAKYGAEETILSVHTLINLFWEEITRLEKRELVDVSLDSMNRLLLGEYRDITRNKPGMLSEEEYWTLCYEKAGAITETLGKIAATAADAEPTKWDIVVGGGKLIGILSQIIDDVLDLEDDLLQGKTSLPIILLGKWIKQGNRDRLWENMKQEGILKLINQRISLLCDEGVELTFKLEQNEYTEMLREVFIRWRRFAAALLEGENCDMMIKKIGEVGIEKAFELMFLRMKTDMNQDEINRVITRFA